MATWQYNGDQQLVLPTLGVVVSKGDQFDGPDDLDLPDFTLAKGKASKPAPVQTNDDLATPVADQTTEQVQGE